MTTKIILDFETSGLNPYHDDIIEIAMKVVDSDEKFTTLLKPKSNECISEQITCLTGITNKMLSRKGLDWHDAYKSMNEWLHSVRGPSGKIAIIAHNGETFDFIFLRRIFKELLEIDVHPFPHENIIFIDTLLLARRILKGRTSYRHGTLCSHYDIKTDGSHRAMNDVIALEQLFTVFMETIGLSRSQPEMIDDYIKLK